MDEKEVVGDLRLNYKFGDASSTWRPFVGVGVNYTKFDKRESTALGNQLNGGPTDIRLTDSWGLAAQAGLAMLQAGGNAVDAAIAAAMALTVVEPSGCGIGSDGFAICWDGRQLHGLNASGRSPAAWTPEYFARLGGIPEKGWNAVTVPGAVSAWVALSKRLGRLPFARLAQPAIDYARHGFPVSPTIARLWELGAAKLGDQPGFAGMLRKQGAWIVLPAPRALGCFTPRDGGRR